MSSRTRKNQSGEDYDEIAQNVVAEWRRIASHPHLLTDLYEQRVMFAAGGGLVTEFGDEKSEIWQALAGKVAAHRDQIEIAGLAFTRDDLEPIFGEATSTMWQAVNEVATVRVATVDIAGATFVCQELEAIGDFYRWLKRRYGVYFHCIDERLEDNLKFYDREVHTSCGACAAVSEATGLTDVEGLVLDRSAVDAKQGIYAGMSNHRSMTIFVDLRGAGVVPGYQRRHLRSIGALSFNVSLPASLIEEYLGHAGIDQHVLLPALVKWNVQIARNIIGGAYNELQSLADRTVLVVDARGVNERSLVAGALTNLVLAVEHGERIEIREPVS